MDKDNPPKDRKTCLTECEKRYVKFTQRSYTGGVEDLRRCREQCPEK